MPAVKKITQETYQEKKKAGRPKGSIKEVAYMTEKEAKKTEIKPKNTYSWICKNGHEQIVHIRCYDVLCHCKQVMTCQDKEGILK